MNEVMHLAAERAPFVMLPRWLLHHHQISDGAKVLYGMLHDLVAGREGPTRPVTRAQLAGCCHVSVATVDRRLAELVAIGAVEKRAQFETRQGQLANVYWVRLSPPSADVRPPVDNPGEGGGTCEDPPAADLMTPGLQPCGTPVVTGAAPKKKELKQELFPPTPRPAGGPLSSGGADRGRDASPETPSRRRNGTNPRALGTHPRAEAELIAAARVEAEAAARQAELERTTEARRAADLAARTESERLEAEALAVSAALDDNQLAAVTAVVSEGMAGPLARSPLAISRAVVAWCRTAAGALPGADLAVAVEAALTRGLAPGERSGPLTLAPAPHGTVPLRHRIAARQAAAVA